MEMRVAYIAQRQSLHFSPSGPGSNLGTPDFLTIESNDPKIQQCLETGCTWTQKHTAKRFYYSNTKTLPFSDYTLEAPRLDYFDNRVVQLTITEFILEAQGSYSENPEHDIGSNTKKNDGTTIFFK